MRTRISQEMWKLHLKMAKAGVDICARPTVLPTPAFFPFKYTADSNGAEAIARVLCHACGVPEIGLRVLLGPEDDTAIANAPVRYSREGPVVNSSLVIQSPTKAQVRVRRSLFGSPKLLSAELLRLVVLLALKQRFRVPLGKPNRTWLLVDLCSVYLGCGVIAANAAFEFMTWQSGWTAKQSGALSEEHFGYTLALYALMKGERSPDWVRCLDPNVRAFFKSESKALSANCDPRFVLCG